MYGQEVSIAVGVVDPHHDEFGDLGSALQPFEG